MTLEQIQTHINLQALTQVKTVRYTLFNQMPNIFNRIIACPISTWNYLPFGKRSVKQIDLRNDLNSFPSYLQFIKPLLDKEIPTYNHILINHYPYNIGIMPHTDGPAYKNKVFVLSLGGPAIINFTKMKNYQNNNNQSLNDHVKVLLEHNSIHIFQDQAYQKFLHGINDLSIDSIFFYEQNGKIKKSDLANIFTIKQRIQKMLQQKKLCNNQYELIQINNNSQFNWKVQIKRKERISITIREKYHN